MCACVTAGPSVYTRSQAFENGARVRVRFTYTCWPPVTSHRSPIRHSILILTSTLSGTLLQPPARAQRSTSSTPAIAHRSLIGPSRVLFGPLDYQVLLHTHCAGRSAALAAPTPEGGGATRALPHAAWPTAVSIVGKVSFGARPLRGGLPARVATHGTAQRSDAIQLYICNEKVFDAATASSCPRA